MRRRFMALLAGFADLAGKNARFADPTVFVGLVRRSDKIVTE
jgi:hypothetical protein